MAFLLPFLIPALMGAGSAAASRLLGGGRSRGSQEGSNPTNRSNLPEGVSALPPNFTFPEFSNDFMGWLMGMIGQGMPGYPGRLSADPANTILPYIQSLITQPTGGEDFMSSLLAGGGVKNPMEGFMPGILDRGGPQSAATDRMNTMADWGGTGGPGHKALGEILAYGRPSGPGGDFMSNMANYGVASMGSGGPLHALATGQPNAATNFLLPFIGKPSWNPTGRLA